jgi:SAM-dependent methyltransferase
MLAPLLGRVACRLATTCRWIAQGFSHLASLLDGLLPALLSPPALSRLIRDHYLPGYAANAAAAADLALLPPEDALDGWERQALERSGLRSGRILVMGAGTGREAIALARRGFAVAGIDASFEALQTARAVARLQGVRLRVQQGDYLSLPYAAGSFDGAVLAAIMFSAIPGRAGRKAWLRDLARVLVPGGVAILSFQPALGPPSRLQTLCGRLNRLLVRLPGANQAYQPGDDGTGIHFLHTFQDETEIRSELAAAGADIRAIVWSRGYVVACFRVPSAAHAAPRQAAGDGAPADGPCSTPARRRAPDTSETPHTPGRDS